MQEEIANAKSDRRRETVDGNLLLDAIDEPGEGALNGWWTAKVNFNLNDRTNAETVIARERGMSGVVDIAI